MFIAMNRFRVAKGSEEAFDKFGRAATLILIASPALSSFICSKGLKAEDHTLYAPHTVWQNKATFEAWTKSPEFRAAHARAGNEFHRCALSGSSEIRRL